MNNQIEAKYILFWFKVWNFDLKKEKECWQVVDKLFSLPYWQRLSTF